MCTVSWVHEDGGYQLLCNRDERRSRLPGRPPFAERLDGIKFVGPRDENFHGTWISTNERGVTLCLLNGAGEMREAASESRGQVVLRLASARCIEEVCERATRMNLAVFAPFTLVALEAGRAALLVEWNGAERLVSLNGDDRAPLISSSFDPQGVQDSRRAEYFRLAGREGRGVSALYAFHESHGGMPGPYSTCMHRTDAETVSFSWVTVTSASVRFFYAPGPLCRFSPGTLIQVPRVH